MDDIPVKPSIGPDSRQPSGKKGPEGQPNLGYTVLIVGDAAGLGYLIRLTLERMHLRVFHAARGSRALEVFHAVHPDLVLLDIALPDMTGWDVLDAMREQQRGGSSPIILVITAYGDPANRLMGKLQGVHAYLTEPLTPEAIGKAVTEALRPPPEQ